MSRWSNTAHSHDRWGQEEAIFDQLYRLTSNRPVLFANSALPCDPGPPLILSQFARERFDFIEAGCDWTPAAILDAEDFKRIAGISGHDRSWRAVIRVNNLIDQIDDSFRRDASKAPGIDEFSLPIRIDTQFIAWLPTGWLPASSARSRRN